MVQGVVVHTSAESLVVVGSKPSIAAESFWVSSGVYLPREVMGNLMKAEMDLCFSLYSSSASARAEPEEGDQ